MTFDELPSEQPFPGITRRALTTSQMTIAGEPTPMEAGDWSLVDPGVQHGITAGEDGARILAIVAPPRASSGEYELAAQ